MEDKSKKYPLYAQIYVDIENIALNRPFTYGIPEEFKEKVYIGAAVKVSFRNRILLGYIVDILGFPPSSANGVKIKAINEVLKSKSLWDREMIEIARWLEGYYGCSYISALKALIPAPVRFDKDGKLPVIKKVKKIVLITPLEEALNLVKKNAHSQKKVLEFLYSNPGAHLVSEIVKKNGVTYSSIESLEKKKIIEVYEDSPFSKVFFSYPLSCQGSFNLTVDQKRAYDKLLELYSSPKAEVSLLHGITGSGKTEIYLQIIEKVLKDGKEALVLVPEISLTPQAIERFRSRFGEEVAILHSRLTDSQRRQMWWKIRNRGVRVVLGARSAIFAPLENIGVIVVDEEHESSYKQEKAPRYLARQVAVKRALTHKCLVILGSATPSFEVYYWAMKGKYHYIELPKRVGSSKLPKINIVNLKEDFSDKNRSRGIIGDTLKSEIKKVLRNNQQVILFLNRRGFSAFLLCRDCSNVIRCPYCDITLTFHKAERAIKCHYCDYKRESPNICPVCGGFRLEPLSWGIQKLEEEIQDLFPNVPYLRMDRDTTKGRDAHYKILSKFSKREASILIGTQMVAKGLDFPGVTLVGVVMADVSLYMPDFRSLERTYQLLVQVSGRAGRREIQGKVVIQTFNPDSPVFKAVKKQNFNDFFNWESKNREKLKYPPFSHVINLLFVGEDSDKCREYSLVIGELLRRRNLKKFFYSVLGPAPCPIDRIKSRYRWHITLKGKNITNMVAVIKAARNKVTPPYGVNFSIDVDPMSIL